MAPRKSKSSAGPAKMEVDEPKAEPGDILIMEEERVLNTYDTDSDLARLNGGPSSLNNLCQPIKIVMVNEEESGLILEFDMIGVDAPIANALRRVLIAEVPSIAIEKIYLYQNTSIIQDEVLCHRIGLLPIYADPREFDMPSEKVIGINENGVDCEEVPPANPNLNLVFNINVACTKNKKAIPAATDPSQLFHNPSVYSKSFVWQPVGDQEKRFSTDPPRMVHDDILVAKLRPGQEIEALCYAVKGIGRDHAKFSPVATASYRLLPFIKLKKPITGEAAQRLKASFSEGVIEVRENKNGEEEAFVVDARRDTSSRNVMRHEDLAPHVELGKFKKHFIFSVESTGALPAATLVAEACSVLEKKAQNLKALISDALKTTHDPSGHDQDIKANTTTTSTAKAGQSAGQNRRMGKKKN